MRKRKIELSRRLLENIRFELAKNSNEDAIVLVDRIDSILGDGKKKRKGISRPQIPEDPKVSDFLDEFIDKLREQLESDHKRWGNTWLNRPKEGQELRTLARHTDYFDQFKEARSPMPWLKIVGGALICWIRENHPELCPDVNECIDEGKPEVIGVNPIEDACPCEGKPELIGIKVSSEGVEDVRMEGSKIETTELKLMARPDNKQPDLIFSKETGKPKVETTELEEAIADEVGEKPREILALDNPNCSAGVMAPFTYPGDEKPVEEMTTKELVESPRLNPIAHVVNERIENIGQGTLGYSPKNDRDGKIILESIEFTNGTGPDAPVLGRCYNDGSIIPGHKGDDCKVGVIGWVKPDGRYKLTAVRGVGYQDTIFVSYDYEFDFPA